MRFELNYFVVIVCFLSDKCIRIKVGLLLFFIIVYCFGIKRKWRCLFYVKLCFSSVVSKLWLVWCLCLNKNVIFWCWKLKMFCFILFCWKMFVRCWMKVLFVICLRGMFFLNCVMCCLIMFDFWLMVYSVWNWKVWKIWMMCYFYLLFCIIMFFLWCLCWFILVSLMCCCNCMLEF